MEAISSTQLSKALLSLNNRFVCVAFYDSQVINEFIREIFDDSFSSVTHLFPRIAFIRSCEKNCLVEYSVNILPTFCFFFNNRLIKRIEFQEDIVNEEFYSFLSYLSAKDVDIRRSFEDPAGDDSFLLDDLLRHFQCVLLINGSQQFPLHSSSKLLMEDLGRLPDLNDCKIVDFYSLSFEDQQKLQLRLQVQPQLQANSVDVSMLFVDGKLAMNLSGLSCDAAIQTISDCVDAREKISSRLVRLINSATVVVFIKGSPDRPKCGFSRQIIQILRDKQIKFDYFDILLDEQVRQGLKALSNWPTYPQLYVKGELIGGLDIVKELIQSNEFDCIFPED